MEYDAVIFDCDGLLIDSEIRMVKLWVAALALMGCDIEPEEYASAFLGLGDPIWFNRLEARFPGKLDLAALKAVEATELTVLAGVPAISGMVELVRSVRVPCAVASSSSPARLATTLGDAGYGSLFEGRVFSSEMVAEGKPAPDIFLHAAEQLGFPAAECLVVEDSVHGVAAGKGAGMLVIGFGGGAHMYPVVRDRLKASRNDAFANDATELASLMGLHG